MAAVCQSKLPSTALDCTDEIPASQSDVRWQSDDPAPSSIDLQTPLSAWACQRIIALLLHLLHAHSPACPEEVCRLLTLRECPFP